MKELDYKYLFDNFEKFQNIQKLQKQRGLNDFNILTTVLKYSDEVRLHSRMIGNLLKPNAKHYQGTLFLEEFLKAIELDNWGLDLSCAIVSIEYKAIDLYITDGNKHIIIENKIWAEDQPCQIMKYINIIVKENKESIDLTQIIDDHIVLDENLIQVLYLTPRAKKVSSAHKIDGDGYIFFSGDEDADDELSKCSKRKNTKEYVPEGLKKYKAKYKKITYKDHILPWLLKSQNEVRNITNLNESIQQYIDVVKRVNRDYKGNVMSLKDYVKNNNIELNTLSEFKKEIEEFQGELLYDFFSKEIDEITGVTKVNNKVNMHHEKFIFDEKKCKRWFLGKAKDFGSFYEINDEYLLYIFVGKAYIHYGIVKHDKYKIISASKDDNSYGLQYRGWKKLKWFSKGVSLSKNLNILNDYNNSDFAKEVGSLIKKLQEE